MTTALEPLVVIDVQDREQWERIISTPGLLTQLQAWARSHGIDPDDTYRVEVYLVDIPFAKVFQYQRNERGRIFCAVDHDHLADADHYEPAKRNPFDVPLNSMPPTPNGGAQ